MVAIFGFGPLAGFITLSFATIGFLAKLLAEDIEAMEKTQAEAIEEIDKDQVEAITATGAKKSQVMSFGILPQIMPALAGITGFCWDINIRESTVLGLVGAGGIGLQLQGSLNTLAWPQVSLILLVIFVAVLFSEWVSAVVRRAII